MPRAIYRRKKSVRDKQGDKQTVPLTDRIISYLHSIAPRPEQPKVIAWELGESHQAVKKAIQRLYAKGTIEQRGRGWYRSFYSLDDILRSESPEMRLHGIKLEGFVPKSEQGYLSCPLFSKLSLESSGNRRMGKIEWESRTVTIQLSESGRIEIYLRCSRYPLSFSDFENFTGWLYGITDGQARTWQLEVVQLGIGKDFRTFELGKNYIKLGQWRNAWLQIYQKQTQMRVEVHINERLSLGDAIHIMKLQTESVKQETVQINKTEPGASMYG